MQVKFDANKRITAAINKCRPEIYKILDDTSDYFAVFYGSYAYQTASVSSDLDFLVVSDKPDDQKLEMLKDLIFEVHKEYEMPLDFDIPYEDKVYRSLDFMNSVCSGEGIYADNTWRILPFEKKQEILTTDSFLKRFFVAMMAHPHIFIAGNNKLYNRLREVATRNLIRAIISIEGLKKISVSQFIQYLCGRGVQTGEMFIGFAHTEACYAYLSQYLGKVLPTMGAKVMIEEGNIVYDFNSPELLKPEIV